ncbi:MAG: hypothetical protein RSG77_26715, partial [Hafnia sp.]
LRSDPEIILVGSHTAIEQLLNDQTLLTQAIQAAPLSMTGHRFITCEDGKAPQYIDYSQLRTEVQEASDYSDLFRPLIYAEPEYTIGWIHPAQNVCELANMPSKTAVLTLTVDMSKYATLQEHRELFEQIYSGIRFNPNFVLIGSSTAVAQLMQDDALFAQTLQAAPFHGDGHRYITCEDGKAPQYIDYSLPRDQNKKHH